MIKGKKIIGILVPFWFLLYGSCVQRFVVEKNSLKLISPESMIGVYDSAIGYFGIPKHGGGTMFGTVVYPKFNHKACKDFVDDFGIYFKSRPGIMPTFLLADRGDCFLTLKAWRAQRAGAAAIIIADDIVEPLSTMYIPEEVSPWGEYYIKNNVTIPSVLISKALGDSIKKAVADGWIVNINIDFKETAPPHHKETIPSSLLVSKALVIPSRNLDWTKTLPNPNMRVKYEFWISSSNGYGPKSGGQLEFVKSFKVAAKMLEQKGYTQFTPRYYTWYCPEAFILSKMCKSQCINRGRYCALDHKLEFSPEYYQGKDIVIQNLIQACFFKVVNETGKPWLWWDYVVYFSIHCSMNEIKYTKQCADQVIQSLGIDIKHIDDCVGDPMADVVNPVLEAELNAQVQTTIEGTHRNAFAFPALVIRNSHYRGKLNKGEVLKEICSAFAEVDKAAICLVEEV